MIGGDNDKIPGRRQRKHLRSIQCEPDGADEK